MEIPQEIRSKISQLDDLANEINEYLREHEDDDDYDEACMLLNEGTEEISNLVTSFQEAQG